MKQDLQGQNEFSSQSASTQPGRLPEAELDVMLCVWQHAEPVRTARLLDELNGMGRAWTLSTLKALLGRLEEKGFVEVTREGRFTLYRALVQESDYRRRETRSLLQRYYKNSAYDMVAALVKDGGLTGADLAELAALLEREGKGDA